MPDVNVGDHFASAAVGVLDYNFGNFELLVTRPSTRVDGGSSARSRRSSGRARDRDLQRREPLAGRSAGEVRRARRTDREQPPLAGHRRARGDPGQRRTGEHAGRRRRRRPSSTSSRRSQAAGGPRPTSFARSTLSTTRTAVSPGGNIRVGFLFRTDRGLQFVDRPGGTLTNAERCRRREQPRRSSLSARGGSIPRTRPGQRAASRSRGSSRRTAARRTS